jgi:flagellum-specific peptidoglycan hydrolase FlgJ
VSVHSVRKPWWQQATALVTVSTGGMITGFTFAPGAAASMTSPTNLPVHLLALEKSAKPAQSADSALRSAIVNVANYYLQLAKTRTPAQMETLIWGKDSLNGADHGESCAAFASLTLELAAQAVGQQSWVTGGSTYPWPVHQWVDARVDPNPASLSITSILQDAQAHDRWHPLGDGYQPQPGDWVLFDGHVEVVTSYLDGVLDTIGGDSAPNLSVNAHSFSGPLSAQGVAGFVDNGHLASAGSPATPAASAAQGSPRAQGSRTAAHGGQADGGPAATGHSGHSGQQEQADIPGAFAPSGAAPKPQAPTAHPSAQRASATHPSAQQAPATHAPAQQAPATHTAPGPQAQTPARTQAQPHAHAAAPAHDRMATPAGTTANIPGAVAPPAALAGTAPANGHPAATPATRHTGTAPPTGQAGSASAGSASAGHYQQHSQPQSAPVPTTSAQQAFINQVAPGAIAAQQRYGVPASVTIAQAIDESAWGQSTLATHDHNLFGIKGTGPAGADVLPTQEYLDGQWVSVSSSFRVYHNIAESIADHARLLATSGYYTQAMADRLVPDAFANDLTGIYATDPNYGTNLIALMRLYNLYRYDTASQHAASQHATTDHAAASTPQTTVPPPASHASSPARTPSPALAPSLAPAPAPAPATASAKGGASIPGLAASGSAGYQAPHTQAPHTQAPRQDATHPHAPRSRAPRSPAPRSPSQPNKAPRYQAQIPGVVATALFTTAKTPIARSEPLYRDVANRIGISWKMLAACDWMQCQAQPRYSPVHGEKLGTINEDGTVYLTKSEALTQCAADLIELAGTVYGIDLTARRALSVRALADAFAAFRWGGLLERHGVSAMEFPYSVAGLTADHLKMHWPAINERCAPDKPGAKFRMLFGAVPVVLSLNYPATV